MGGRGQAQNTCVQPQRKSCLGPLSAVRSPGTTPASNINITSFDQPPIMLLQPWKVGVMLRSSLVIRCTRGKIVSNVPFRAHTLGSTYWEIDVCQSDPRGGTGSSSSLREPGPCNHYFNGTQEQPGSAMGHSCNSILDTHYGSIPVE